MFCCQSCLLIFSSMVMYVLESVVLVVAACHSFSVHWTGGGGGGGLSDREPVVYHVNKQIVC